MPKQNQQQGLLPEQELQLAKACMEYWDDPLAFVEDMFRWGAKGTFLERWEGPDKFQRTILKTLRDQLKLIAAGLAPSNTVRIAVSSGHGIGKTAVMAMIELWWQSTRPNSKSVTTAGTQTQLSTKTWRELEKWRGVCATGHWFKWHATSLKCIFSPNTWNADAIPWSENNAQAFAGTHEEFVMYKFDEASTIADSIWETSEGAFTTPGPHIWLAFGNPEQATGRFRECWTRHRHRWITLEVDARDSAFSDKKLLQEWIDTYGEDSDFVRIRVKGQPPRTSPDQFITTELWERAQARWNDVVDQSEKIPRGIPLLMGVDVGAGGSGLTTIVFRRGGFVYKNILRSSEGDPTKLAAIIATAINQYRPAVVFIDGTGPGWAVYNILMQMQYRNVVPVFVGSQDVQEKLVHYNVRVEMWDRMKDWMKTGALPYDVIMRDDLLAPKRYYNLKNQMLLESKDAMKKRGIPSPDTGDALALTFSMPVAQAREIQQIEEVFENGQPVEPDWEGKGASCLRTQKVLLEPCRRTYHGRQAYRRAQRSSCSWRLPMHSMQVLPPHEASPRGGSWSH